jgi:hypothetical protein
MNLLASLVVALVLLLQVLQCRAVIPPGSDIQTDVSYNLIKTGPYGSQLYVVNATSVYTEPVQLMNLKAPTSFQQGFDMGYMLGAESIENYNAVMVYLLGDEWWEPAVARLTNAFLDWQWENYLSKAVPSEYIDEMSGLTAGGLKAGVKGDVGKVAGRATTIANFPGSLENLKFIFEDEKENPPSAELTAAMADPAAPSKDEVIRLLNKMSEKWHGLSCSMFGVWGSRTEGGRTFTGRNLDWLQDMGISKYKLITVFHPPNGNAHATVGWTGIWGAITGMSAKGLSVHEANLESNDITFRGFPWVLRLRHVMAYSSNIQQALTVWNSTGNTVGFNHGVGSDADNQATVMETMMHSTAVFGANDPREQDLVVDGQQIGVPRTEAVYRTNHGYDPYTIQHYMWNNSGAYQNSIDRYMMFPEIFDDYTAAQTLISVPQAVNVTALLGDKGDKTMYDCSPPHDGSNILSVTFDLRNRAMYTAWENGHGDDWAPAACNTYIKIDLTPFF